VNAVEADVRFRFRGRVRQEEQMRVIAGGVLGGLVMFVWGAISHMALPLGEAGIRSVPAEREEALLSAMRESMNERALYFFPGLSRDATPAEQDAWAKRAKSGPIGIVAYNPVGAEQMTPRQLLGELGFNMLACLAASFAMLHVPLGVGYGRRVAVVASFGFFATMAIDGSYWNWYGFPTAYLAAQLVDGVVGALIAGLVIARVVRPLPAAA
jgi:hypothetical protein